MFGGGAAGTENLAPEKPHWYCVEKMDVPKKKRQQKRGRERRIHILKAARELLEEKDLNEISLADVAARTDVPLSSLYHFYPNLQRLLAELVPQFSTELLEYLRVTSAGFDGDTWEAQLDNVIENSAAFYEKNPGYKQLILSGKAPDYIKRADRRLDDILVKAISARIAKKFVIPDFPERNEVFGYALQIVELAFSLSVIRTGVIKPNAIDQGKRAAKAYLRTYLPEVLPPAADEE